jgi:hypothetical protein
MAIVPAMVEAQDGVLQLEGHVLAHPAARIGFRLGERAVVLTGIDATFSDFEYGDVTDQMGVWAIPLEAKLYFVDSEPGSVVPLTLLGGTYGRATRQLDPGSIGGVVTQEVATNMMTAYWLVGVDYFVSRAFAIELSAGPHYWRTWGDDDGYAGIGGLGGLSTSGGASSSGWGITWRLGVIVRP